MFLCFDILMVYSPRVYQPYTGFFGTQGWTILQNFSSMCAWCDNVLEGEVRGFRLSNESLLAFCIFGTFTSVHVDQWTILQ